jgi:hypothetical protein
LSRRGRWMCCWFVDPPTEIKSGYDGYDVDDTIF